VLNTILESTGQAPMQSETIGEYFNHWLEGKELAKKAAHCRALSLL